MSYRITNIPPITGKTTLENAGKWLRIVRYNEYGIVIQFLNYCKKRKISIPQDADSLEEIVKYIGDRGYEIGLFISRINKLLQESDFRSILKNVL